MKQIALDIGLHTGPTLTNFFAGPNTAALQHLNLWASSPTRSPVPTYLWGGSSSGKTHLLRGVAHALREQGVHVGWLDASILTPPDFDDSWSAVLMDDVHLYTAEQQHAAFNWFVNAMTPSTGQQRWVLAAGATPPADLMLREDLRTRLGWGHVFALQVLSEPERRAVLRQEADARGVFERRGDGLHVESLQPRPGQPDGAAGRHRRLRAAVEKINHRAIDKIDDGT
jgi:DnaA-homolog protein